MFEIIALVIAVTAVASLARGRGKSPFVAGCVAVVGYVSIVYGGSTVAPPGDARLALMVAGWVWIGLVAGYLRFVVGIGKPKPDGRWNCANCNYLNNASSIVCEACQQPWQPKESAATSAQ